MVYDFVFYISLKCEVVPKHYNTVLQQMQQIIISKHIIR